MLSEDEINDTDNNEFGDIDDDNISGHWNVHDSVDYKSNEFGYDLDPDEHLFNNITSDCEYYSDEKFRCIDTNGAFSIIHLNSRSLYKNYNNIKDYLNKFDKFSVIAVSETWLDEERCCEVQMDGYEMFTTNRINKRGGGVALYVDAGLRCKKIDCKSITIDGVLECLTVEILVGKSTNIIVSCLYRTPGSPLDSFNQTIDSMFSNINKVLIVCGDFNINLLNPQKNTKTTDFITAMYFITIEILFFRSLFNQQELQQTLLH